MNDEHEQHSDRSAPEPISPDPLDDDAVDPPAAVDRENEADGPLDRDPEPGHLPSETGVQAERQPLADE